MGRNRPRLVRRGKKVLSSPVVANAARRTVSFALSALATVLAECVGSSYAPRRVSSEEEHSAPAGCAASRASLEARSSTGHTTCFANASGVRSSHGQNEACRISVFRLG